MESAEIIATCDTSGNAKYTSAEAMLEAEPLDFVDIATRPDTHLPLLRMCVERKLPAIVQKPMAPTMEEARAIVDLAASSKVPVMIHENWRWQPWHREMLKRLNSGAIGTPFGYHFTMMHDDGLGETPYPNQPYFRAMPKLLMFESLIHPLDVARFYFGDIERVSAVTRRRNAGIAGEDRAVILLSHRSEVDGVVEGQRYLQPEPPGAAMGSSLIEGDRGRLLAQADGGVYWNGKLVWQSTATEGYKGDSVKATQEHFIDCLRADLEFETSPRRYFQSFAAIEAAYQSAREHRMIAL